MSIRYLAFVFGIAVTFSASCYAQQPRGDANAGAKPSVTRQLPAGGGSRADFTTLIDLIQTVVPGDWDNEEDTITPFANGVWIDPKGIMHRPAKHPGHRFVPNAKTSAVLHETLGELEKHQDLRWISLNEIDAMLADPTASSRLASPAGLMLGGLSRIDYLHWDARSKSWYVGGPAGDFELNDNGDLCSTSTQLPPLLLEDLLTLSPLVLNGTKPFGCTIDPSQQGLANAAALLSNAQFVHRLSSSPKSFAAELGKSIGPQNLTLINLPSGCPTGVALLVADEHMKRMGLELTQDGAPKVKITSYWDAAAKQKHPTAKTMVRWWFAFADKPLAKIANSDPGCVDYHFDRLSVRVQTESEWMQANGKRVHADEQDPAAEAFAKSFTENFSALQKHYPMYGRLRHIFDSALVLEMIRRESEIDPAKFPHHLAQFNNENQRHTPLGTVDSLVAVKKLNSHTISAVVSGGVMVNARQTAPRPVSGTPIHKVDAFVLH